MKENASKLCKNLSYLEYFVINFHNLTSVHFLSQLSMFMVCEELCRTGSVKQPFISISLLSRGHLIALVIVKNWTELYLLWGIIDFSYYEF